MRGRKPLSAQAHEPQPVEGMPDMPEHLTGVAAEKWRHLAELLTDMNVITTADKDMMELYCVTYAAYREALANVAKTGQVLVTREDHGKQVEVKRNPFSTEFHRYADRMAKLLVEMGLTPSSRTRVTANPKADEDPFTEWLKINRESLN